MSCQPARKFHFTNLFGERELHGIGAEADLDWRTRVYTVQGGTTKLEQSS